MRKRIPLMFGLLYAASSIIAQPFNIIAENVIINPGDTAQMQITITDLLSINSTAFQFDITLPSGISISRDDESNLIARLNDKLQSDHILYVSEIEPNIYRFISFSMTNAIIPDINDMILSVTLYASDEIETFVTTNGYITSGMFVRNQLYAITLDACKFSVSIQDKSGIITSYQQQEEGYNKIYNLRGQQVNDIGKGILINNGHKLFSR
ncbi:MAG: hypothetical protein IK006_01320 [Bacteroidaceae bacterium]|nr:hypothetical protein [Bacteroidaceae bacterium]